MADSKSKRKMEERTLVRVPGDSQQAPDGRLARSPLRPSRAETEQFIVDNSDEQWKAGTYLHGWCSIASAIDVATGYFEIGALLSLDGQWQKLDQIRILMGDEVSKKTRQAFEQALGKLEETLDESIEREKETNRPGRDYRL